MVGLSRRSPVPVAVLAVVLAVVVAGLAVAISFPPVRSADAWVSSAAVGFGHRHRDWTEAMWTVTQLGGTLAAVAVLAALAVLASVVGRAIQVPLARSGAAHRGSVVAFAVAGLLVPGLLVEAVKHLVDRPRPDPAEPFAHFSGFSFPSGHATHIAADVVVLWFLLLPLLAGWSRRVAVLLGAALVLVVGWSRVALGAHYPTDVVAGWALGAAWVTGVAVTLRWTRHFGGEHATRQERDR